MKRRNQQPSPSQKPGEQGDYAPLLEPTTEEYHHPTSHQGHDGHQVVTEENRQCDGITLRTVDSAVRLLKALGIWKG